MDLEQRVQALEQELQILKNEIQVILLDIHEQVLSNTYPDLRSDDTSSQNNKPLERPRSDPEEPVGQQVSPVRKVSLDTANGYGVPQQEKPTNHNLAQETVDLEGWVSGKIKTIGAQETAALIRRYAATGRLSSEVADSLLEFVAFHSVDHRDIPTQPSRSAPFEVAPRLSPNGRIPTATAPTVRQSPVTRTATPVKPKSSTAKTPLKRPKAVITKTKPKVEDLPDESPQNVVLRLIAGIQNAGAGVRWGKHDG